MTLRAALYIVGGSLCAIGAGTLIVLAWLESPVIGALVTFGVGYTLVGLGLIWK